jgi:hypothetical protein
MPFVCPSFVKYTMPHREPLEGSFTPLFLIKDTLSITLGLCISKMHMAAHANPKYQTNKENYISTLRKCKMPILRLCVHPCW